MKNSDIFNEYARIALEKGLISEGKQDANLFLKKQEGRILNPFQI